MVINVNRIARSTVNIHCAIMRMECVKTAAMEDLLGIFVKMVRYIFLVLLCVFLLIGAKIL
jgi:hypothetical protein